MIERAIVIAGGLGSRLQPPDSDGRLAVPKAMVSVGGKPLLERNLEWLKANGVSDVMLGVAHRKEKIVDHFGDGRRFGVRIRYSIHRIEDGTGDAFLKAMDADPALGPAFFAMNSDQLTDFPLQELGRRHLAEHSRPLATLLLVRPMLPFGVVETAPDGRVARFSEKPRLEQTVNAGIYVFDPGIRPHLGGDIERSTFASLADAGRLCGFRYDGFWETVNTAKDLERIEGALGARV
jgi:NDP-sugar pyrophosphorylase family protein